jgi:hypothetical protein
LKEVLSEIYNTDEMKIFVFTNSEKPLFSWLQFLMIKDKLKIREGRLMLSRVKEKSKAWCFLFSPPVKM